MDKNHCHEYTITTVLQTDNKYYLKYTKTTALHTITIILQIDNNHCLTDRQKPLPYIYNNHFLTDRQ